MKILKYILMAIILVVQVSCVDKKFEDEFLITVDPDAVVNKINLEVYDLTDPTNVLDAKLTFTGENSKYVYNEAGERNEVANGYEITADGGSTSFGIERKANATKENPITVTMTVSATGFNDYVVDIIFDGTTKYISYPVLLLPSIPSLLPVSRMSKINKTLENCEIKDDTVLFKFINGSVSSTYLVRVYDNSSNLITFGGFNVSAGATFEIKALDIKENPFYNKFFGVLLTGEYKLKIDIFDSPMVNVFNENVSLCEIIGDVKPIEKNIGSTKKVTDYNLDLNINCDVNISLNNYPVYYKAVGDKNYKLFQVIKKGLIKGKGPVLEDDTTYQFRIKYDGIWRETPESGTDAVKGSTVKQSGINLNQNGLCEKVNSITK